MKIKKPDQDWLRGHWLVERDTDTDNNGVVRSDCLKAKLCGRPGCITIKADDEGFTVDIVPDDSDIPDGSLYSAYDNLRSFGG